MFETNDDHAYGQTVFELVRTDDGTVLMTRRLRPVDADSFNRQWHERGVPTRWRPTDLSLASVA